MRRAFDLAKRGPERDANPRVGCVILNPEMRIVAEGWHHGAGTAHAEINALQNLPVEWADRAGELTAVVTLEPCNHQGLTGPCSEALIAAGIGRVVYALDDPGEFSSGGASRLREAGIAVTSGVLKNEARELLRDWLAGQELPSGVLRGGSATQNLPRITVKWAQSLDGRIAAADGTSKWITGGAARAHVHRMRQQHDAIMVGTGTVLADNPSLTVRDTSNNLLAGAQPLPVIVGERVLPQGSKVFDHPALIERGIQAPIRLRGENLRADLISLSCMGIGSVYVEGGQQLISSLLREGLVDELHVYTAGILLGGDFTATQNIGVATITEALQLKDLEFVPLGLIASQGGEQCDLLITAKLVKKE